MNAQAQAQAQVESIVAMVAALDVDYGRLEELRELVDTPRFVAGWNMAGYMPDSEPAAFDDFDDAKQYIIDQIKADEEQADDESKAENLCALAEDVNLASSEFSTICDGTAYWVTQDGAMLDEEEGAREELAELEAQAGDCTDEEDARQRIQEDALSVEVRSGWGTPGDEMTAEEFRIVLCTGGPHVEIVGDLNRHGEPASVRILYRDWSESGELFNFDHDAVRRYASEFFG